MDNIPAITNACIAKVLKRNNTDNINEDFESLRISSINFVKLILALENAFDIQFLNEDMNIDKYNSIDDLYAYIETRLKR